MHAKKHTCRFSRVFCEPMNHDGISFLSTLLKCECSCLLNMLAMSHGVSQRSFDVAVAGDINLKGFFRTWREDLEEAAREEAARKSSFALGRKTAPTPFLFQWYEKAHDLARAKHILLFWQSLSRGFTPADLDMIRDSFKNKFPINYGPK